MKRLIVGLGNPGDEYAETRHNIGWLVLDKLAAVAEVTTWKMQTKFKSETAQFGDLIFIKPQTFMNHSGQPVRAASDYYKLDPEAVLIISDDIYLPFGEVRYRAGGGAGGQKGLADVLDHLGTQAVPRVRIGIGQPPEGRNATDFVLGKFTKDETAALPEIVKAAVTVIKERLDE